MLPYAQVDVLPAKVSSSSMSNAYSTPKRQIPVKYCTDKS